MIAVRGWLDWDVCSLRVIGEILARLPAVRVIRRELLIVFVIDGFNEIFVGFCEESILGVGDLVGLRFAGVVGLIVAFDSLVLRHFNLLTLFNFNHFNFSLLIGVESAFGLIFCLLF